MNQAKAPTDSKAFRAALGTFTTGVTIVTTQHEGVDVGLTANSFNSVSLDPPMVLWSLARTSGSLAAFLGAEHFAVHVLAADQEPLSNRFATRSADRFAGLAVDRGRGGVPLLAGCAARFQCRTAFRHDGGDHEIFIGEVLDFEHSERTPLVYHAGRYGVVMKRSASKPASAGEAEMQSSFGMDFLGYLLARSYQNLFAPIRRELQRRGLGVDDYYLLNILARFDNRTVAELDALFSLDGRQVTSDLVAGLVARGHVEDAGAGRMRLTGTGRRLMIELVAVAKGAESHAERDLDYGEAQMLKQLLRQVIRSTDGGPPQGWSRQ